MKPLALVQIIFNLGCVYSIFPIMPSLAGSVPVGASSGVTLPNSVGTPVISRPPTMIIPPTAPSVIVPPTAPSVTVPSTAPSVTVPSTASPSEATSTPVVSPPRSSSPIFVVTPITQAILNNTATQTLTELREKDSIVGNIVVSETSLNLSTPVSGITITPYNNAISPSSTNTSSVGATGSNLEVTPLQVGLTTATQVESGNGVEITSNSVKVNIPPVSLVSEGKQVSTTVTITANEQNLNLVLTGTGEQVSNGAGFLAMAAAADFSLDQMKMGTSIALTGAKFGQVGTLINSIGGLMVIGSNSSFSPQLNQKSLFANTFTGKNSQRFTPVAQSGESNLNNAISVNPERLNIAILAFNQIIDDSDDATIVMLSKNQDFLTIGKVLKGLRKALNQ